MKTLHASIFLLVLTTVSPKTASRRKSPVPAIRVKANPPQAPEVQQVAKVTRLIIAEDPRYFIKNHLGSTMRVVNSDGSYATTPVFDYQPYGELQSIREDSLNPVTQKFTGKELDTEVNLYYFGARWYDAELGAWISPDAAGQYFNPYSYADGNVVMLVDADGNFFFVAIFIGMAIGAYYGGAKANDSWNPMDWDADMKTVKYMAGGAAIGGAIGAGAAIAGAYAGAYAASSLGFTATGTSSALGLSVATYSGAGAIVAGGVGGAVAGGIAGFGNALAFGGGLETGFFNDGNLSDADYWKTALKAGAAGAVIGGGVGALSAVFAPPKVESVIEGKAGDMYGEFGKNLNSLSGPTAPAPSGTNNLFSAINSFLKEGARIGLREAATFNVPAIDIAAQNRYPFPRVPMLEGPAKWLTSSASFSGKPQYDDKTCVNLNVSIGPGGSNGAGVGKCPVVSPY